MKIFQLNNQFVFGESGVSKITATANASEGEIPFAAEQFSYDGNTHIAKYRSDRFTAQTVRQAFAESGVLRQVTEYCANEECLLTQTGAVVEGIAYDEQGIASRLGDGSILVHYCFSRWQGEGQWRTATPEDLGVYAATRHEWERSWCRFQSLSSWSTATYFPILIVEDRKAGQTWFFTVECGRSWFIELYTYGGIDGMKSLSVKLGGADEQLGFCKQMKASDVYTSAECAYGVVQGDFEDAIGVLVKYWRESSLVKGGSPLVFNDYMNCNWTNESEETLFPLIDRAAELGCEIFCLDDGWQEEQGVWYPHKERFGKSGLEGIFARIREKGMGIGVWFEFETVRPNLQDLLGADDCFLFRNGHMIAPHRPLANFRSEKLIAYLNERVDALYQMGVRFIKNDHNNAEHLGVTIYGESPAEGLERNERAFLAFIDGLRARYPDLILENCASGAMRSEHGTLRHFHIQSTSDQEDYLNYPSVLTGSLALMSPEKAGIWCYPYPLLFGDRLNLGLSQEQIEAFADGEQTVFNVVSGFMGNLYLSGKLHQADEYNTHLLKEGLDLYKETRESIFGSIPVFPCGMIRLSERRPHAMGLISADGNSLLLAVWNLTDDETEFTVDLSKYGMKTCEMKYPCNMGRVSFDYRENNLSVRFSQGRTARLFLLKK